MCDTCAVCEAQGGDGAGHAQILGLGDMVGCEHSGVGVGGCGGFVALGPYTQGMSDKPPIRWSEMHTHPLAISPVHRSIECYDEAFRPGVQFS